MFVFYTNRAFFIFFCIFYWFYTYPAYTILIFYYFLWSPLHTDCNPKRSMTYFLLLKQGECSARISRLEYFYPVEWLSTVWCQKKMRSVWYLITPYFYLSLLRWMSENLNNDNAKSLKCEFLRIYLVNIILI